jgi:hypothetical protein
METNHIFAHHMYHFLNDGRARQHTLLSFSYTLSEQLSKLDKQMSILTGDRLFTKNHKAHT